MASPNEITFTIRRFSDDTSVKAIEYIQRRIREQLDMEYVRNGINLRMNEQTAGLQRPLERSERRAANLEGCVGQLEKLV